MKKFFSMLVAFATIFAFVACEGTEEPAPTTPTKLKKPVLKLAEKTETGFTIEWTAVENAASYVVMFQAVTYPTTETQYSFTDLEPGEYKVQVMAVAAAGSNYKDSSYADITVKIIPPDTGDWFTQELNLGTNEAEGYYPTNSIYVTWKGTDVEEVQYGLFPSYVLEGASDSTIKANLNVLDQYYEDIASEEGLTLVFNNLNAKTEYTVVALATSKWGYEIFLKNTITTDSAEMASNVESWLGTWSVSNDKTLRYFASGNNLDAEVLDETIEKTWNITFHPQYSNTVAISGMSSVLTGEDDVPAMGFISDDGKLNLLAGIAVGSEYDGYTPIWCPSFTVEEFGVGNVVYFPFQGFGKDKDGNDLYYAPYTITMEGTTATSVANPTTLYATVKENGEEKEVEMEAIPDSFDIYAVSAQGGCAVYGVNKENDLRVASGTYTLTKVEAAPAKSAKKLGAKVKFPEVMVTNSIFVR